MRAIFFVGFLCAVGVGIAGCADPNIKATHINFGTTTDTVTMGPALRVVTERNRELEDGRWLPTMCSEPSPDVAVAFGRTLAAQGSYSEPGAASVSGSVNAASTEVATTLAGRTAGVLALRDGLYAACQSYTNGVLGHDAYAIVLSQYGNLLVALAGVQTSGTPATYTAQESAVAAMLVACVSEHDPTRARPLWPNGKPHTNPLLSVPRCEYLLNRIAAGKLLAPLPQKTGKATTTNKTAKGPQAGEKITTTPVTEKAGAPFATVTATGTPASIPK